MTCSLSFDYTLMQTGCKKKLIVLFVYFVYVKTIDLYYM